MDESPMNTGFTLTLKKTCARNFTSPSVFQHKRVCFDQEDPSGHAWYLLSVASLTESSV